MGFFVKKNPYLEIMFFAVFLLMGCRVKSIGINWGTQATHPLPPGIVVRLLRDNGFQKVKLFEADSAVLNALSGSGIQVMVGIQNDMLPSIATSVSAAQNWVRRNVSAYISSISVDIRYIAVGNEPFLQTYNGTYNSLVLPALQNIQAAVISAGLGNRVAVTVPLNADVYRSSTPMPSTGNFRVDIHDIMVQIATFLSTNNAPFMVNIYPFISLYDDRSFPVDYAFFGGYSNPIIDNGRTYNNVFDANHDTLVWALQNNGFSNMSIIVGEIGWPTDGDINANPINAQRFNQGFMNHVLGGTPMRPGPIDAYLFSLIDEDAKSIQPGNFERHWGLFYYDGTAKYNLSLSLNSSQLVPAHGVQYQRRRWCVFSSSANLQNTQVDPSVSYACSHADCTSLGYGTSCGNLDAAGNVSYAFNSYYQINNQLASACVFSNLAVVTETEPSAGTCRFNIMIQTQIAGTSSLSSNLLWVLLLQSLLAARSIL